MPRKDTDEHTGIIGFFRLYWRELTRYMFTGMLVWVPLMITAWVAWFFIKRFWLGTEELIDDAIARLHVLASQYTLLGWTENIQYTFGMGALVVAALFLTTGFLARFIVGRRIIGMGEAIVERIPLISRIYKAVVQIRDVFINRQGAVFQHVCLVEYPRAGMIAVAFVTSKEHGIVQELMGCDLHAVFIPTTPNPTSGYLVYLPPEDITLVNVTIEEAMKLIVSAGAYIPDLGDKKNRDDRGMDERRKRAAAALQQAAKEANTP